MSKFVALLVFAALLCGMCGCDEPWMTAQQFEQPAKQRSSTIKLYNQVVKCKLQMQLLTDEIVGNYKSDLPWSEIVKKSKAGLAQMEASLKQVDPKQHQDQKLVTAMEEWKSAMLDITQTWTKAFDSRSEADFDLVAQKIKNVPSVFVNVRKEMERLIPSDLPKEN